MSGMQQPMPQQEQQLQNQLVSQQLAQQMVLCPVRLVYETQILVQPGEQIQPNQTFFINPQNPPPWMQNRPVQNQAPVMYVQQLPNNVVSSVQQPMDQNQLYLQQNLANYQMQQQILAQNQQELLPTMQLANIMPNMVQNVQQTQNERQMTNQVLANQTLVQNVQNQMQLANARQLQNQVNQNMEAQRQVFMNLRPQMVPQIVQKPMMAMSQPQNIPTQNVQPQQTMTNMPNVQVNQQNLGQMYVTNVGQRLQHPNIRQPVNNVVNIQPVAKVRETAPVEVNKPVNNIIGSVVPTIRNIPQNYAYRPIQPRPQMTQTMPNIPKSQPVQIQNAPNMYNNEKQHSHHNIINIAANTTFLNNPTMNRKRKSESPDEILKKIAANNKMKPNINSPQLIPQQNITITKLSHDIGVNTSPKHVINKNIININPINPNSQNQNQNQQIIKLLENSQAIENTSIASDINASASQLEKDKLIRNTVFTQARGRVLQVNESLLPTKPNDPILPTEQLKSIDIVKIENNTDRNKPVMMDVGVGNTVKVLEHPKNNHVGLDMPIVDTFDPIPAPSKPKEVINPIREIPKVVENTNIALKKNELKIQENKIKIEQNKAIIHENQVKIERNEAKLIETKVKIERQSIKTEEHVVKKEIDVNVENTPKPNEIKNVKMEYSPKVVEKVAKTEVNKVKTSDNKVKVEDTLVKKEETLMKKEEIKKVVEENEKADENKAVKQEKDFILTHVVDGYVIQESNFAFPIRKPLKEKTLYTNAKKELERKDAVKESIKEELKSHAVDIPLLPFHYLLLNSDKKEEDNKEKTEIENKEAENPFSRLQLSTVKTWTVDDLSSHLLQHKWKETASVLQEHEIDGESLALVSKAQLVTIGISEEHADAINEFVRS